MYFHGNRINVNSSFEELDRIQAEAIEAGMGFRYKVRGVSKKKLIIDMVIEHGDTYEIERVVVMQEDGIVSVSWEINNKGEAIAFITEQGDGSTAHQE